MEAHARSPRDLFEGKEHYEIPPFQRPYVWNEEDQWAPLWEDVLRVAESNVRAALTGSEPAVPHHFLGAVVYESRSLTTGDVARHDVIDGQQRMTTLQVLIAASRRAFSEVGCDDMAEALEDLTHNPQSKFRGRRERFKLWPSKSDRDAFAAVMDGRGDEVDHRLGSAYAFFYREAKRWVAGLPDEDGAVPHGTAVARVEALAATLQDQLLLVAIDLTGHDDSQLIFETLNDRGTPLLKADLIKNWVFRQVKSLGVDDEEWAGRYWSDFDNDWWRAEITQGRLTRSRIDIFLQYWLTMRLQEEVKAEHVFRVFVDHAKPLAGNALDAEGFLEELKADADTYKGFADLDHSSAPGHFHRIVIETMELAVTTPIFLWLLSDNHQVPEDQQGIGLRAIESWVIRRLLLRLTTKDVNRFMVATLKELAGAPAATSGDRLRTFLSEQTAVTRYWPSDDELLDQVPQLQLYGWIRQSRIRAVFAEVENYLRSHSDFYESVSLPAGLEIEHIMPRGWRTYWDVGTPLDEKSAAQRDRRVNTIGNLTLITKSLNASLSNRPWTDSEAIGLKEGGHPNQGKHTLLEQFSLLALNKEILKHQDSWTEDNISQRSALLTGILCQVWPGPDERVQLEARRTLGSFPAVVEARPDVPWSAADMRRLASQAGAAMTMVLDTLARHPGEGWSNRDFEAIGVHRAFGVLGALTMKVRGSFGRENVPVHYEEINGEWHWSLPLDLAALWRDARGLDLDV